MLFCCTQSEVVAVLADLGTDGGQLTTDGLLASKLSEAYLTTGSSLRAHTSWHACLHACTNMIPIAFVQVSLRRVAGVAAARSPRKAAS